MEARTSSGATSRSTGARPLLYLSLVAAEWALVLFVRARLRRAGASLSETIGGRWNTPGRILADVALAGGMWLLWRLMEMGFERLPFLGRAAHVAGMLPRGPLEIALWIPLSLSAGFAEELFFRGYLQRAFAAWTHRAGIALVLQAVVFGVVHGYQGVAPCARITCFGLLYGIVALWRRSLRPGMIAHASTDIVSGIFGV